MDVTHGYKSMDTSKFNLCCCICLMLFFSCPLSVDVVTPPSHIECTYTINALAIADHSNCGLSVNVSLC
ncbi:hypothetical protein AMTRI_Chr03g52860 [Amborella trichopoda]